MPYDQTVHIEATAARDEIDRFGLQHIGITWAPDGRIVLDGQMSVVHLDEKGEVAGERQAPDANVVLDPDQAKQIAADFDSVLAKLRDVMESAYRERQAQLDKP